MGDNNYFSEYIKLLDKMTEEQIKESNLLNIFCEYISSNPEFKYNGTYLRDSMADFQEKLTCFIKKRNLIISFTKKLFYEYDSLGDWYIIIDNLYVITPDCKMKLLLNFERYSYFNNLISKFNIFKFNTDYISMRYVRLNMIEIDKSVEIKNEYLENQKIKENDTYKEIKLYSMVNEALIPKNIVKVGKNNEEQ